MTRFLYILTCLFLFSIWFSWRRCSRIACPCLPAALFKCICASIDDIVSVLYSFSMHLHSEIPSWGKPAVSACEPAHWGSRKETCRNYHATNKFKNNLKYFKIPTRTGLFSSYTVEDNFNDFHLFRLPSDTIEEKITELGGGPQWDRIPPMIVDMHDFLNYTKIKELSEIPENSYRGRSIFIVYSRGKINRVAGFPLAARYHCGKINRVGVWASLKSDSADNYWILILCKPVCSLTLIVERILCVTLFIADTAAEKLTELGFWELSEAKFCTHPKSKIPLGIK